MLKCCFTSNVINTNKFLYGIYIQIGEKVYAEVKESNCNDMLTVRAKVNAAALGLP